MSISTRTVAIGFLFFAGITALDVVGPMDAFTTARIENGQGEPRICYEPITIGITGKEITAESGLMLRPMTTLAACPRLDTLIIPGGRGLRETKTNAAICTWILSKVKVTRRIATVCTGIYGLAPTGLLDGRRVTTHWGFARDVARQFPALRVEPNALFLKDGQFYTSAGVTAGIALSLALIEEDFGTTIALAVARELVVHMKRSGGQEQYSEPLKFQIASTNSTTEVASYIQAHLDHDLSVPALAKIARLSERQFGRQFKSAFRTSPAAFVENVRLDESRRRLCETRCSINQLADSDGFASDDAFRRAFERRFGISPTEYRVRFDTQRKLEAVSSR
jgi:transcriptional regulator GlxA family with amidase domain